MTQFLTRRLCTSRFPLSVVYIDNQLAFIKMSKNIGKKVRPKPREKPEDVQKYAGPLTTFASSDFDETGLPKPAEYSQTDSEFN